MATQAELDKINADRANAAKEQADVDSATAALAKENAEAKLARDALDADLAALKPDAPLPPPPPPAPTISAFTVAPTSITAGQQAVLRAQFANGTATLGGLPFTDGMTVQPAADTTYVLVVTGAQGATAQASVTVQVTPVVVLPPPPPPTATGVFRSVTKTNATNWEQPEPANPALPPKRARVSLHGSGGGFTAQGVDLIGATASNSGAIFTAVGDASMGINDAMPFLFNIGKTRAAGLAYNDPNYTLLIQPRSRVDNAKPIQTEWFGYEHFDAGQTSGAKKAHAYEYVRLDAMVEWVRANCPYIDMRQMTLHGYSMGAWGAARYGIQRPQYFAALFMDKPCWSGRSIPDWENNTWSGNSPAAGLLMADGVTTYASFADSIAWIKDPTHKIPPVIASIGRHDQFCPWSETVAAFNALLARDDVFVAGAWTDADHNAQPPLGSLLPYTPDQFTLGVGYPIFRRSTLDTGSMGDGTLVGSTATGKFGNGFKWRVLSETATTLQLAVSNSLGACTVDVRPSSTIFPCAGVPFQTVAVPAAGAEVTVTFNLPSSGTGGSGGGGTTTPPTTTPPTTTPPPSTTPSAFARPVAVIEAVNMNAAVVFDLHHFTQQYSRYVTDAEITKPVTKIGARCVNFANGGALENLAYPRYGLDVAPMLRDGTWGAYVERGFCVIQTPTPVLTFSYTKGPEDGRPARFKVVPYDASGNRVVGSFESYLTFPMTLNVDGTAKDFPYAVAHDSTHRIVKNTHTNQYTVLPTAAFSVPYLRPFKKRRKAVDAPVPLPADLVGVPFNRYDTVTEQRQQAFANSLVLTNVTAPCSPEGNDLFRPAKTQSGAWVLGGVQAYFLDTLFSSATKFLPVHSVDGPRGVAQVGFAIAAWPTARTGLDGTKFFVHDPISIKRADPDGTITTLVGLLIKDNVPRYTSATVLQDESGKPYAQERVLADYDVKGNWDASIPPALRFPNQSWWSGFIPESLPLDTGAPLIGGETPHANTPTTAVWPQKGSGPQLLILDYGHGRLLHAQFNGHDRAVAPYITVVATLNKPFGGAFYKGDLIVGEEGAGRVIRMGYDGTVKETLYTGARPQAVDVVDDTLYLTDVGFKQVISIDLITKARTLCRQVVNNAVQFMNISVSDGTLVPKHTVFLSTFSDELGSMIGNFNAFGIAPAYLPIAGTANGVAQSHLQDLYWHANLSGRPEGVGGSSGNLYPTSCVFKHGVGLKCDSTYGVALITKADAEDLRPLDVAGAMRGAAKYRAAGYSQIFGQAAWPQFGGIPLPFGEDPDIDNWMENFCGCAKVTA